MVGFFQNFLSFLSFKKKRANVLVVGLDNSGKSTVVNYFKAAGSAAGTAAQRSADNIVPTIGFQVDQFKSLFL